VRGVYIDAPSGRRVNPAIANAPATNNKNVSVGAFNDRHLKISPEWRVGYRFPCLFGHVEYGARRCNKFHYRRHSDSVLDFDQ